MFLPDADRLLAGLFWCRRYYSSNGPLDGLYAASPGLHMSPRRYEIDEEVKSSSYPDRSIPDALLFAKGFLS